jgi:hypothetical protein
MKITRYELIKLRPCADGFHRFCYQTDSVVEPIEISSLVGGFNNISDLIWLADKLHTPERLAKFGCDCVSTEIERIKPFTDCDTYDKIIGFLDNPCIHTNEIDFNYNEMRNSTNNIHALTVMRSLSCLLRYSKYIESSCRRVSYQFILEAVHIISNINYMSEAIVNTMLQQLFTKPKDIVDETIHID